MIRKDYGTDITIFLVSSGWKMETTGRKKHRNQLTTHPGQVIKKPEEWTLFSAIGWLAAPEGCHFLVIVVLAVHLDVVQGMLRSCYGGVGGMELITFLCSAWWLWCYANMGLITFLCSAWWLWCYADKWVWAKIGYPNSWMVNIRNRLRLWSIVLFIYNSLSGWKPTIVPGKVGETPNSGGYRGPNHLRDESETESKDLPISSNAKMREWDKYHFPHLGWKENATLGTWWHCHWTELEVCFCFNIIYSIYSNPWRALFWFQMTEVLPTWPVLAHCVLPSLETESGMPCLSAPHLVVPGCDCVH